MFSLITERIVVISEYHFQSLVTLKPGVSEIKRIAHSVLLGLVHLNETGITHRALSPDNILITKQGNIKLFNYGLYHMTNHCACVSFPIGCPKYMAPEVLLSAKNGPSGSKVDVWSLGFILAEISLGKTFWSDLKLGHIVRRVLSLVNSTGTIFERLANEHNCGDVYRQLDSELKSFVNQCLSVDVKNRPTPRECLNHSYLDEVEEVNQWSVDDIGYHIGFLQRVSRDNVALIKKLQDARNVEAKSYKPDEWSARELSKRSLKERYFLWQLAGGDVYSELKKQGMIKSKPPILTLPK